VVSNIDGGLLAHTILKRIFRRVISAAKLPVIRLHDLRHTVATLLLKRGVNINVVSELLEHADASTTLNIYAHVLEGMKQQTTDAIRHIIANI
jgi:integrase